MTNLNTDYLSTNRGIIKILQVICGFITCSLLCANWYWYGGKSCFYEGPLGYASGLNFVIVIINIILFFLNFLNVAVYRMERLYSVIGVILFTVAYGLMIWYLIEYDINRGQLIAATLFIGIQMVLFVWDYQILQLQQQLSTSAKSKVKVDMDVVVWTEVLGFLKRVELANIVSLTNRQIHDICWPRLHGSKVMAHEVRDLEIASREDGWSTTAILLIENHWKRKEVPFANCPPPDYITGFSRIQINFLDDQVLAFIKVIVPHLTEFDISIMEMKNLDEQQRGLMNRLLKMFQEKKSRYAYMDISTSLDNIPFLPDMDNKTRHFTLDLDFADANTDIPLLMEMLATPRPDGQQRMIRLNIYEYQLVMEVVHAIKQDFHTSTRPQPFYILCDYPDDRPHNLNIPNPSEEENAQTDETLTLLPIHFEEDDIPWCNMKIFRHPKGEQGKWAEDAHERVQTEGGHKTNISVDVS